MIYEIYLSVQTDIEDKEDLKLLLRQALGEEGLEISIDRVEEAQ